MKFNFNFDFLTPEQNGYLSESMGLLVMAEKNGLRRLYSDLDARNSLLVEEIDRLNADLRSVRDELMDSHRANSVLRESLEKEREQVVHLSGPRPADADAEELRSQNEIMTGVIERLKDELRTYSDFAKRIVRTAETAPERALEDEKA